MTTKRPIDYRPADLVVGILALVLDDDDPTFATPEAEVVELLSAAHPPATVARTMRELVDFGALRRVTPLKGDRTPKIRMTPLGRAWVDRRLEDYVRGVELDDQADDEDASTLDLD